MFEGFPTLRGVLLALLLAALSIPSVLDAQRRGGQPKRRADAKLERVTIPGGPLETPAGRLTIVADLYMKHAQDAPFLVLFHSTGGSRGEYRKAGITLSDMGYNCLAVDMRVGGRSDFVRNLTRPQLFQHGVQATVLDVVPDIINSLKFARENYAEGPLLCVGSAASATLCMLVANEHPELLDGLFLFSPPVGYFEQFEKPADWARRLSKKVKCPTFLTGLRSSKKELQAVFDGLGTKQKMFFEPGGPGVHGAKALWPKEPRHVEYWGALTTFLEVHFPLPEGSAAKAEPGDVEGEGD